MALHCFYDGLATQRVKLCKPATCSKRRLAALILVGLAPPPMPIAVSHTVELLAVGRTCVGLATQHTCALSTVNALLVVMDAIS